MTKTSLPPKPGDNATPNIRFWRDPAMPWLEARKAVDADCPFDRHTHRRYSVGAEEKGRTHMYHGGLDLEAGPGDLLLFDPGVVHGCSPVAGPLSYRIFYIGADWFRSLACEVMGEGGQPRFTAPVARDPELFVELVELSEALHGEASLLEKEDRAYQAFARLIERHCGLAPVGRTEKGAQRLVVEVKGCLSERVGENVSLAELSAATGVSPYHLLRVFKKATGLPPHAWQTQLRIGLAKDLIARGEPLSDAALEAGFADQSHLSKVFRKLVGATPGQYRRADQ